MSIEDSDAALTIVEAGRQRVSDRMRAAFDRQIDGHPELGEVDPVELDRLIQAAVDRAGASLWRIGLAEGAADTYGISVAEAASHPAVNAAEALVGATAEPLAPPAPGGPDDSDPWPAGAAEPEPVPEVFEPEIPIPEPEPAPAAPAAPVDPTSQALRVPAVHASGIETLKSGDKDIELRLSDAGLDVLRRSSGAAIGRLEWIEITAVEIEAPKKGLRGRKRAQSLEVRTGRGHASFELPGLSEEESAEHLEPLLARLRAEGRLGRADA